MFADEYKNYLLIVLRGNATYGIVLFPLRIFLSLNAHYFSRVSNCTRGPQWGMLPASQMFVSHTFTTQIFKLQDNRPNVSDSLFHNYGKTDFNIT